MYQIPGFLKFDGLRHFFSEKSDGNMSNIINGKVIDANLVLINRKRFMDRVNIDIKNTVSMWVTHTDKIVEADPERAGVSLLDYQKALKTDGLITNIKGLNLFLLVADCLPVILFDPIKSALALIHAGWKGVNSEIVKKGVNLMKVKYSSKSTNMVVGIGPCVYKSSFIKENPVQKNDPKWMPFIEKIEENKYSIDLIKFTKKQLTDSGIPLNNIFESSIDTGKDERFFSHVRDKDLPLDKQGRFACIVGLK